MFPSLAFLSFFFCNVILLQHVSVTATQTNAVSAWRCFSSRAGRAAACARSVATTRLDATASTARTDTPATTASRSATARPANVSHAMCVFTVCVMGDTGSKGTRKPEKEKKKKYLPVIMYNCHNVIRWFKGTKIFMGFSYSC